MNTDRKLSEVTRGRYASNKIKSAKRRVCLRKASANYVKKKK